MMMFLALKAIGFDAVLATQMIGPFGELHGRQTY